MLNIVYGYIIVLVSLIICLFNSLFCENYNSNDYFYGGSSSKLTKEQAAVKKEYSQYKKSTKQKTKREIFDEFCSPRAYRVQNQQKFAADYMRPIRNGLPKHKSLLVYHKIGAGKTCLSIQIAEKYIDSSAKYKPLIIMPASLIPGFRAELRSPCAGDHYIDETDRTVLKELTPGSSDYKEIIKESDELIDEKYNIVSYNKFLNDISSIQGGSKSKKIKASIVIIDEIQNIINTSGTMGGAILKWVLDNPDIPIVCMSGTPIFDSPQELTAIARYLRIDVKPGAIILPEEIPQLFAGKVSYFPGADPSVYPEARVKIVKKPMSKYQQRWYKSEVVNEMNRVGNLKSVAISNDFYIKSRQRANIVFPNGLGGTQGLASLTPNIIKNSLETYSCKFATMVKKIKRCEPTFIYTAFTGPFGISAIVKILNVLGFSDFAKEGPGKKRYAIFSGDATMREKDKLRATFNSAQNDDCSQIQIIIASPAAKEGVSLFRVKQAHVIDIPWNKSKLQQILGRVIRYCSHRSLPSKERYVDIYLYAAIASSSSANDTKIHDPMSSIDLYMLDIAERKMKEIDPYLEQLILCAVDRGLFQ